MRQIVRYLCYTILIFFTCDAKGQFFNPEFEHLNTDDGLSQNFVFCIAQDYNGFMWFGTGDGLSRYDGYEFRNYKNSEEDSSTINANSVRALLVAKDSSMWIGTTYGVCRYYLSKDHIQRYPVDRADPHKLSGLQVNAIQQDQHGNIWISYLDGGVNVVPPGEKEILHYSQSQNDLSYKIKNDLVTSVLFMPDGNKLISTLSGVDVLDNDGLVMSEAIAQKTYPWIVNVNRSVKTLQLAKNKKILWIGTELNGIYRIDLQNDTVINYNKNNKLNYDNILCLMEDDQENLWIGTEVLYLYKRKTKEMLFFDDYGSREKEVAKNPIYCLFEDRDKNIWLGTQRTGILKHNPQGKYVLHYRKSSGEFSLKSNQIHCFLKEDPKRIWVGTDGGGLVEFNIKNGEFKQHPLNNKLSSQVIKTLYEDHDKNLWVGTWQGGFMKIYADQKTLEVFSPENKNFESRHVWSIKPDSLGNLWLGTLRDGLYHFSPASRKYTHYKNIPGDSTSLINDDILTLMVDSNNALWIGTGNGLSILYPGRSEFINLYTNEKNQLLSGNIILAIREDNLGRIWVGTNGGGITILSKDRKILKVLKEKQGLPSNSIASLQPDLNNDIWASTYNGIVKIDYRNFSVDQLPHIDGLQKKEYDPNSSLCTDDGKLLFGGSDGFIAFHPDSLNFKQKELEITFTSLKIFNEEVPLTGYQNRKIIDKPITEAEEINLSYKDYSVTLTFSPITYNWQETILYAYYLENLDEKWQHTTSGRRFVHYSNLAPGNYILKVKASYDGKNWSDKIKSIKINISSPWWGTTIFKVGAALFACLALLVAYKVKVKFLEVQKKKLATLVDTRTTELKKSNGELLNKNIRIETQNEEIQTLLEESALQKNDIEQKNEELQAQHDILALKSSALEEAQKRLQEVNRNLEHLIDRRTDKLNIAVRELETFLYHASHDLRGPISSMFGLINVAALEQPDSLYLNFLRSTTARLERTLNKLVQRHTIEKRKLQNQLIDKNELLLLVNDITLNIPHFRVGDFVLKIDEKIRFEMDKTMLTIVISNLLENAFFFSQGAAKPTVRLEIVQQKNNTVSMVVEDFGAGIKPEIKDKIFTMFFRGNELSSGNGLGLYLVQNALLRMNGKIELDSMDGIFTRFIVTLDIS